MEQKCDPFLADFPEILGPGESKKCVEKKGQKWVKNGSKLTLWRRTENELCACRFLTPFLPPFLTHF
jgi:hypothetical protein